MVYVLEMTPVFLYVQHQGITTTNESMYSVLHTNDDIHHHHQIISSTLDGTAVNGDC